MRRFLLFFLIGIYSYASGQVDVKDSAIAAPMIGFSYAMQLPGADMAKRFGYDSNVGLDFLFKTKKNLLFGAQGTFLFGNRIKESGILDSISTSTGAVINSGGEYANINLFERGYTVMLRFGKLFNVFAPNVNSGIVLLGSAGYIRHKIRIQVNNNDVPELSNEYKKGYDRLTAGVAISQYVGYLYLSNERMVNFYFGFEATEGFTKSLRPFDYDLMRADTKQRLDILYGIRIGWILPLYSQVANHYYYY